MPHAPQEALRRRSPVRLLGNVHVLAVVLLLLVRHRETRGQVRRQIGVHRRTAGLLSGDGLHGTLQGRGGQKNL